MKKKKEIIILRKEQKLEKKGELFAAAENVVYKFNDDKLNKLPCKTKEEIDQLDQLLEGDMYYKDINDFVESLETRVFRTEDELMYEFLMFLIDYSDLLENKDQFFFFGKTFYESFYFYTCEKVCYQGPVLRLDQLDPELDTKHSGHYCLALVPVFDSKKVTYYSEF